MKLFNKLTNQDVLLKLPIEDRLAIASLENFNNPYKSNYLFT